MYVRTRDDLNLHVQELGRGPTVVLLHGLVAGNLATWYFGVAPRLAQHFRVVMLDFRSHGRSERSVRGYGVAQLAADLRDVLAVVTEGEPVALVGHSYGGCVALHYALHAPEAVRALALVDAPLPPTRAEELDEFLAGSPERMVSDLPERLRDAVIGGGRRGRRFLEAVRFLVDESEMVAELRQERDFDDRVLAALRPPLLAVYGTESRCLHVAQRLAQVVPKVRSVLLAGGHNLPFERAAEVADALNTFLSFSELGGAVACRP